MTWLAFTLAVQQSQRIAGTEAEAVLGLAEYLRSGRLLGHAAIGAIGAAVNVQILGRGANVSLLALAGVAVLYDTYLVPYACAVYLAKTMAGDFVAGKLDTAEWRLVLAFSAALAAMCARAAATDGAASSGDIEGGLTGLLGGYGRIAPLLVAGQVVCEVGDNNLERYIFFRHRYSFELCALLLLFGLPGGTTARELAVLQVDMVTCLFYRIGNLAIIFARGGLGSRFSALCGDVLLRRAIFWVFGALRGERVVNVTDARVATAVLRASASKGAFLERTIAVPAWAPVLSVESVDGELHRGLLADFHAAIRASPGMTAVNVAAVSRRLIADLLASGEVIDANAVARLTLMTFIECMFERRWEERFEVLVEASWEWRKQIAVRGRANDGIKRQAIALLVDDLLPSRRALWELFADEWQQPRRYSVIMQPVLLSPAINAGDIAVALQRAGVKLSLENAVRSAHPFPILERAVTTDVVVDGKVAVRAPAQVVIFTSDLAKDPSAWPIFGAGPRICAGASLALPLLREIRAMGLEAGDRFQPARGHRYSGRHNDASWTLGEMSYFARRIAAVVGRARSGTGGGDNSGIIKPLICSTSESPAVPSA